MLRSRTLIVALLGGFASAWCGEAAAHDGHEHEPPDAPHLARNFRTWTHASGRFQVHGSFVAMHGDLVQVRREDGDLLDIRLKALSAPDRAWVEDRRAEIGRLNTNPGTLLLAQGPAGQARRQAPAPAILQSFQPFAGTLGLRWDDDYFYVESNGIPAHRMMVGIVAWQQQVPLPQPYRGGNAWRIPLHPVPAREPMSAKEDFFRGAIALAVNGIPIFNPIKNDGRTDTYLAGELDEYGGHCGRADDYHYHIAPVHLEPGIGKGKPLAYALDGYPIYGYDEPDGSKAMRLDAFNGHEGAGGSYHYHASKTYPYLNGGFHGEVTERGGQVDPQPRAEPVRPALPPLRGARITDFRGNGPGSYSLTYEIRGRKNFVNYTMARDGSVTFQFVNSAGRTTTETYRRREGGPGPEDRPGADRRPPGDEPPPRGGRRERRPPPPVMAALDKNGDGELSREEIAGASKALLTLDRNRDGRLSEEELRPERPPDEPPPPPDDDRPPPPR